MLSPTTLDTIEDHWSARLGVSPDTLGRPGVIVIPHTSGDFRGYRGLYAYRRNDTCIISVPDDLLERVRAVLTASTPHEAFDPQTLSRALDEAPHLVIGPAALLYTDAHPADGSASSARLLTP